MSKPVQFNIAQPCHENWQKMLPADKGRHCSMCRKTVVDFTGMTDREIVQHFANATGGTCGRFHSDQLNRDMIYKKESRIPWLKYFFQFTLPAFLVSLKTTAQNSKVPDTVQVQPIPKEEFLMGDTIAPVIIARTIEGIVKDKEGAPLHGVTVMIKGTSTGTATDATGNFKITVNDENEHTLVFSYVGYAPFELGKISAKKNKAVNVKLEPSTMDLLGVVIIAKSPKKKRSTLEKARSILTPDSVKLFPNPVFAGNDLNIELKVKEKGVHVISVTDFNGRAVLNTTVEAEDNTMKTSISTNQLLPGNYIVTVYNRWGKNIGTKKIIVQ